MRQLKEFGYRAIDVDGASAALALLERQEVAVLFSDIVMPGEMDGFEMARHALVRWPAMKVVLTSGFPETKVNGKWAR